MVIITNKQDRKKLFEGRTRGMGFGFCKKIGENEYETVQAPSACKDYLSDVVWCEANDLSINVCGLKYKRHNIYNEDKAYLLVNSLISNSVKEPYNEDNLKELKKYQDVLNANINNMITIINHVETQLGLPLTTVDKAENLDSTYLLTLSKEWCKSTPAISLYSLILRVAQFYDGSTTPDEYMDAALTDAFQKKHKDYWDREMWGYTNKALKVLIKNKVLPNTPEITKQHVNTVHNMGIYSYVSSEGLKEQKLVSA